MLRGRARPTAPHVDIRARESQGHVRRIRHIPVPIVNAGTEGKPIRGVAVNVSGVMAPDKLEELLKAWQRGPRAAEPAPGKGLIFPLARVLHPPLSDKDSKVEIPGIGADRFDILDVKHPEYMQSTAIVVDSSQAADVDRLLDGAAIHLVNTDPPYNVRVEPRSYNAIAAGLSSFPGTTTHHQSLDLDRHPEESKPTTKRLSGNVPCPNWPNSRRMCASSYKGVYTHADDDAEGVCDGSHR